MLERRKGIYADMYLVVPSHCLVQIQISTELLSAVYCVLFTPWIKDKRKANKPLQHRVLSCGPHADVDSAVYAVRY